MKKLVSIATVVALLAFVGSVMAAGEKGPRPPRPTKPHLAGVVAKVTMSDDGKTLVSFDLKQGKQGGGKTVTVEVNAETKYMKGKNEAATAEDVKVGGKVVAFFKEADCKGSALAVHIVPDKTPPTPPPAPK